MTLGAHMPQQTTSQESIRDDYADSVSDDTITSIFHQSVALLDRLRKELPQERDAIYAGGELLKCLALIADVPAETASSITASQESLEAFVTQYMAATAAQ